MPRISILLSALNAERYLPQALESLRAQTWKDWECIAIDDGSVDKTSEIFKTYEGRDKRFKSVRHQTPEGLTASLIEAAGLAKGEFLARQDADDWSEPIRLEREMVVFEQHPNVLAVGSRFAVHYPDGRYLDTVKCPSSSSLIRRALFRRNPFAHGSLIFHRSAYERVTGYRSFFRYAQDYDLLLRLAEVGDISVSNELLYHHRLSVEGIGRSKYAQQNAYAELARQSAEARSKGKNDAPLFEAFQEPMSEKGGPPIDEIALHLVKSGQRKEAEARLNDWCPEEFKGRAVKCALSLLNRSPGRVRQACITAYQTWRLR